MTNTDLQEQTRRLRNAVEPVADGVYAIIDAGFYPPRVAGVYGLGGGPTWASA